MTSIKDALKEVRAAYKSTISDDYIIVMKNGDTFEMDSRAADPNGLNVFAGNINEYQGMPVPEGLRINKHSLPDKVKIAIKDKLEMETASQLCGRDFNELGYSMSYKGDFAFKNETGYEWKKDGVISLEEIDDYSFMTENFPDWQRTVGEKLKAASYHEDANIEEEIYNDYLWEWVNGYSLGIKEQLEEKGFVIEE